MPILIKAKPNFITENHSQYLKDDGTEVIHDLAGFSLINSQIIEMPTKTSDTRMGPIETFQSK